MRVLAVIPARMGSSRFPGKPLAPILGKPMIGHVYENVSRSSVLDTTVVATCDADISEYISSIGGRAIMTGAHHERASDRCAEALDVLEKEEGRRYDIVIMVQGDEPMTHPDMIEESVLPMVEDPAVEVVNLMAPIRTKEEFEDRNCVKVVCDVRQFALYFSREPIPARHKSEQVPMYKQVCVIPFRRDFLLSYTRMPQTPLEIEESIDMLRVLEHGMKVRMVMTSHFTQAVDTPADLKKVEDLLGQPSSKF